MEEKILKSISKLKSISMEELINEYLTLFHELPPKMKMKNYAVIEDLIVEAIVSKTPVDKEEALARYLKDKSPAGRIL